MVAGTDRDDEGRRAGDRATNQSPAGLAAGGRLREDMGCSRQGSRGLDTACLRIHRPPSVSADRCSNRTAMLSYKV